MTFTKAGRLSWDAPLNVGALMLPVAVVLWVWPASALPENVGTPAGQDRAPVSVAWEPVKAGAELLPAGVAVKVWVWVERAEPVNAWAVTVRFGAVALQAVAEPVPAAMFVVAQFPEVALAPFVPAGVPALTAELVAEEPVKTSAGTVPGVPVNVGAATVPAGV
jgi:hypothetical protein